MKVVIIGGGIAGLSMGIFLNQRNIEVVVNERAEKMPIHGHAFMMHRDGLGILKELNLEYKAEPPGRLISEYSLRDTEGVVIKHIKLTTWKCMKRSELIRFLYALLPNEFIKQSREFSHFLYEGKKAIAAVFLNGDVEHGDLFIGADGGYSKVREVTFGQVQFTPVEVKEIVGIAYNEEVSKTHSDIFTKFKKKAAGLSFGLIPTSDIEFVWFMQYDARFHDLSTETPEGLEVFCKNILAEFPEVVGKILETNDFKTSYVFNTRDFDLLPTFHKQNVALIGDAAHLALPFTSAGTTNALVDARTLAYHLSITDNYEQAFKKYYDQRSDVVNTHISFGRQIKKQFLDSVDQNYDNTIVPLIKQSGNDDLEGVKKEIQVLYFTDPICSTCWLMQPALRKIKLEYDDNVNIKYCMGGLLPSWENYNKGKIQKPSDAAKHWEEVSALHETPLDGDVWIEDPLNSSYPPSIAFKAAQLQDTAKAILFLRRIKEMVFVEKKNIVKWEFLKNAAIEVGLDSARLLRDFDGRAKDDFKKDLALAAQLGVTNFPTLFFSNRANKQYIIKGYQAYEKFEKILQMLIPDVQKKAIDPIPQKLFAAFPSMTEMEFAFLSDIPKDEANKILVDLWEKGSIGKYEGQKGCIWISKFDVE